MIQKLRNVKVGSRVLACFLLCSLLFVAAGDIGILTLHDLNADYSVAMVRYGYAHNVIKLIV